MRGFWRMLESIMAVSLIMFFVLSLSIQYVDEPVQPVIKIRGYWILENLEKSGKLRGDAVSMDVSSLESKISVRGYNHSVRICSFNGTCAGPFPDQENVWSSTYLIAGDGEYDPREVKLYVW